MKHLLSFALLVGILTVLPSAHGADPAVTLTGNWTGAFDFQGSSIPLTFHFAEAASAVTGSVDGLPTTPAAIHDGKVDGGNVSFWVNTDYQGQIYKLNFAGQVLNTAGDLSFTLGTQDGSWSAGLTARKSTGAAPGASAPNVTGTWKGSFDFQGTAVPVTLHLTSTAGAVTGTVQGMLRDAPDKAVEIHDGKLDGDTLTWWLTTQYQGEPYKIVYKGTLAAGEIHLSFGTDDGSWSAEMTATRE